MLFCLSRRGGALKGKLWRMHRSSKFEGSDGGGNIGSHLNNPDEARKASRKANKDAEEASRRFLVQPSGINKRAFEITPLVWSNVLPPTSTPGPLKTLSKSTASGAAGLSTGVLCCTSASVEAASICYLIMVLEAMPRACCALVSLTCYLWAISATQLPLPLA